MIVDRAQVAGALPGYELGAQLGAGGFGLVLAARHRGLGRQVAIKIVTAGRSGAGEAQLLARLDHPHIVRVYDYAEAGEILLIVMEMLGGGTLTRRQAEVPPEGACAIGLAVAAALSHAHAQGVLHRDIKPDNVLFDTAGLLKVTDFGTAKIVEGSAATASGVVGTPLYMAPEQILGGRLCPATDLYALGTVLYQLLAGAPPFDPTLPMGALRQHHIGTTPAPPPGVPATVAQVVLRALAKDPDARQPSAHAFALDLAVAAAHAYGRGWAARSGIVRRLDDDVRDAADGLSTPTRPAPAPSTPPPAAAGVIPPSPGRVGDPPPPEGPVAPADDAGPADTVDGRGAGSDPAHDSPQHPDPEDSVDPGDRADVGPGRFRTARRRGAHPSQPAVGGPKAARSYLSRTRAADEPTGRAPRRPRRVLPVAVVMLLAVVTVGTVLALRSIPGVASARTTAPVPFFVTAELLGEAVVRDTVTGAVTARVTAPEGPIGWEKVFATEDPYVYVLVATVGPGDPSVPGEEYATSLYRLTLTSTGAVASLTKAADLPPGPIASYNMAVTPDGARAAYPLVEDVGTTTFESGAARIHLVTLATGQREVFETSVAGSVGNLSWDSGGRYLAFTMGELEDAEIWVLDTWAGHDLLANARRVPSRRDLGAFVGPVLSADGKHLYVIATQQNSEGDHVSRIVELEVQSGAQERILFELPYTGGFSSYEWGVTTFTRDSTGSALLVMDYFGHGYRVDLASARHERFPLVGATPGASPGGVAW